MARRKSKLDLGRKGETAFGRLNAAVRLRPRFGLALALSEHPTARAEVLARLRETAPAVEQHPPALGALQAALGWAQRYPKASQAPVLWVEADSPLDAAGEQAWREWLAVANRERENLHAAGHVFVVLAGPESLRTLVREGAPDLWALSPPVSTFDEEPRPLTLAKPGSIEWLHLSDFHLGRAADGQQDTVLAHLARDLPKLVKDAGLAPQLVFVTGDLAWSGKPEQYELVHAFLGQLLERLDLTAGEALFLVPGNHDVDRLAIGRSAHLAQIQLLGMGGESREDFREATTDILGNAQELEDFGRRLAAYCTFTSHLLGPARGVSTDRPFRTDVRELGGVSVGIASLCSAWLCGPDDDKKGRIVLGERQVRDALAALDAGGATLRIVLLHHPLEWLHEAEDHAVRELLAEADVVLHGHLHETELSATSSLFGQSIVSAAGAAYAGARHAHAFQAARFEPATGQLTLHFFKYVTRGGGRWSVNHDLATGGRKTLSLRALVEGPAGGAGEPNTEALGTRLKQAVRQVYGRVDFVGLADNAPKPKTKLDELYVPASFEDTRRAPGATEATGRSLAELEAGLFGSAGADDPLGHRVAVLGDPGSGKSTLVLHIALAAAGRSDGPIPVVVKLREYARQGRSDGLLSFAASECTALLQVPTDEKQLEAAAREGKLLLLVDGFDEVVDEQDRVRIRDQLVAFAERFPRAALLATSRSVGYDRAPLPDDRFATLRLLPFGDDEIRAFIERWYRVAIPQDPRLRERQAADLWGALEREPRARALARVPLLATLIALVHRYETNLPGERAALYDLCVKTLVVTWPRARGRRFTGLDEALQRAVLESLALRLQERRGHDTGEEVTIGARELVQTLTELFTERGFGSSASERRELAERWVQWLQADTGLVVEQQPGVFAFLHLSLLEFLAGRALLDREGSRGDAAIAVFILYHHSLPHWRETCLLALGSESTRRGLADASVELLLGFANEQAEWSTWVFLLAALREEVDVRGEDLDAIVDGAIRGALGREPHAWVEATHWLADVLRFGRRHGAAVRARMTAHLARGTGDLLAGAAALAPDVLALEKVLDGRADRAAAVGPLLDFGPRHVAGRWARSAASPNDLLAWVKGCPADVVALRTIEGLEEPRLAAPCALLVARAFELGSFVARQAPDRVLPAGVRWRWEDVRAERHCVDVWLRPAGIDATASSQPFAHPTARDFARDFALDFARQFPRDFARDFGDFDLELARYFAHQFPLDFARYSSSDLARYFSSDLARYFSSDFLRKFARDFAPFHTDEIKITSITSGHAGEPAFPEQSRVEGPWHALRVANDRKTARRVVRQISAFTVAQACAGLALGAAAELPRPLRGALVTLRVQDAWLWLNFEPLVEHVRKHTAAEPNTLGLLLALGVRQWQTTGLWPWGQCWAELTAAPAPAHWFAAYWWHVARALTEEEPEQAEAQHAAAQACLDRSDWPELADELRRCRFIRTPPELAARFGTTLPTSTEAKPS